MKNKLFLCLAGLLVLLLGCSTPEKTAEALVVGSPNGELEVAFFLHKGSPHYRSSFRGETLVDTSALGLVFREGGKLGENMKIADSQSNSFDNTWEQVWGEERYIRNHYQELKVRLQETSATNREMVLTFRVYNDGYGFRYEVPGDGSFELMEELTEFKMTDNHQAWWIEAYQHDRYEYLYQKTSLSEMPKVHTPLTLETQNGLYLSFHEAALTDYASMVLAPAAGNLLKCELVPWPDGVKVRGEGNMRSSWRTLQVADTPGDLITSYLILNLNEPNKIEDVSWIKPGKYVGIWWGMHLNKNTWGSGPKHGATTAQTKAYMDFAAKNGLYGVLVEGWNEGWDGNWYENGDVFNFTKPYPDFDIAEITRYGNEKGVKLIGHHETGAGIENYEAQLEDAFAFYQKYGVEAIKTGYVGHKAQKEHWHHGQYMVRHYRKVTETAAKYRIMLDVHEPIKDTGIRRTYPNFMTREGARGMEYNAWKTDGGNPPNHTTILPFTRLLAGPMDYTPGIFELLFEKEQPNNRVNTTLAKQLALYVVIYSPMHMAADLIENYEGHPAFQFIRDVPVDWETTKVLNGEIGQFITIARKDRNSDDWYLGSITNEEARQLSASLDFLPEDKDFIAEIYRDGPEGDWKTKPYETEILKLVVSSKQQFALNLVPSGGVAIRFRPATPADLDGSIQKLENN